MQGETRIMPKREYYCAGCGLFHWSDMYVEDPETGRIETAPYIGCPNPECPSHQQEDSCIFVFAVDTMGYYYFSEQYKKTIDKMKWSSPKYAPEKAINIYRKQGIPIRDETEASK